MKDYLGDKINDARMEIEYQAENIGDKITGRKSKRQANSWREHAGRDFKNGNVLGGNAAAQQSRLWQEEHRNSLRLGTKVDALKRKTTDEYKLAKENNRQNNLRGAAKTSGIKNRTNDVDGRNAANKDYIEGHKWGKVRDHRYIPGAQEIRLNKRGVAQLNSQNEAAQRHEVRKFELKRGEAEKRIEEGRQRMYDAAENTIKNIRKKRRR